MIDAPPEAVRTAWTCPFCPLLCDDLQVRVEPVSNTLQLAGGDCALARRGLAQFTATPSEAAALIAGRVSTLDDAVAAAARRLASSRQPLIGGLGTDVAGARALYRLACASGAICDAAQGEALMQSLRAQQDRGGFGTTLAEIRNLADLIVCVGGLPTTAAPNFFERCGVGEALVAERHVVLLGAAGPGDAQTLAALADRPGVTVESVPLTGDLFTSLALLAACVAERAPRAAPPGLVALAARLRAARYAVIVGTVGTLPAQAALVIEAVDRIVATLNLRTRAAAFWIGGGNGAGTVNEVFTWLSGLPLRSRAGPQGLEHEPIAHAAARLLAEGAVDALLWVSSFDAASAPPPSGLPLIVIGHPALAASTLGRAGESIFIPASTPGVGSTGHLFRSDGGVVLPLSTLYADRLPTVAEVVRRLTRALQDARAPA